MIDRETVTDALRFWEIGRVLFNLVLMLVTVLTVSWNTIFVTEFILMLFVMGGFANACYCAAYPIDLLVQASEWRQQWRRWRWLMWFAGTLFAAALAHLVLSVPLPLPQT